MSSHQPVFHTQSLRYLDIMHMFGWKRIVWHCVQGTKRYDESVFPWTTPMHASVIDNIVVSSLRKCLLAQNLTCECDRRLSNTNLIV